MERVVDDNTFKQLNMMLGTESMCDLPKQEVRSRLKTVLQSILNTSDFDNCNARLGNITTEVNKDTELWIRMESQIIGLKQPVLIKCLIDCSKNSLYASEAEIHHWCEFFVQDKSKECNWIKIIRLDDLDIKSFNTAYDILDKLRFKKEMKFHTIKNGRVTTK